MEPQFLDAVALQFVGSIEQVPPLYSNVKVNGKRAHKSVRSGSTPLMKTRRVFVHSLKLEKISGVKLSMRCTVSSGTYIRSLARDIAEALGTCGYLVALRRTAIGNFSVPDIPPNVPGGCIRAQSTDFEALYFFEVLTLTDSEKKKFWTGVRVPVRVNDGIYRICNSGSFLGLGRAERGLLSVEKVYPTG
ncbi:MAG: tRNA pseudouridine synthase B [Turneriella sp.]|nr:tRNA pseudouridine synthase B [Turneriella sp.]